MMNDETEQFEQRLRRQPVKEIPGEWRTEILAAAHAVPVTRHAPPAPARSLLSTLLWPHPKAWAGLAAVWIFILVLNFSLRDRTPAQLAEKASRPSLEMVVELRQQQRLFGELMGPRDPAVADRSKTPTPRPRSQWTEWQVG